MKSERYQPGIGIWLATGSLASIEIAVAQPIDFVVLDAEHGEMSDESVNRAVPIAHAAGVRVYVKVRMPSREPIQRCLDFGADGVIVPHITSAAEAALMASYAKYPPSGDRSLAAERAARYGMDFSEEWVRRQNQETSFFAMIEDDAALTSVDAIAAVPSVDGLFPGAVDLAIRRGRGLSTGSAEAFADLQTIIDAARAHEKRIMMPAWSSPQEQRLALDNHVDDILVAAEYLALAGGFHASLEAALSAVEASTSTFSSSSAAP